MSLAAIRPETRTTKAESAMAEPEKMWEQMAPEVAMMVSLVLAATKMGKARWRPMDKQCDN